MLRQLVITKKIQAMRKQLDELKAKDAEFEQRKAELKTREAELEAAVNEITDETPEDDKAAVDESVAEFEKDREALNTEIGAHESDKKKLEEEIQKLQAELDELNERSKNTPPAAPVRTEQRGDTRGMKTRVRFFDSIEQRNAFFTRDDVKQFISEIRSIKTRGVTNGSLSIPEPMLEILRDNMEQYSKLIKYINLKPVKGKARQNIMGTAPEGVWIEAEGELNELDMSLNQIEVDGFMVGGVIWVHDNLLNDSDIALGTEIMDQLGKAIGSGVDRAILYGTGIKMPVGIVTRLAQTAQPANWDTDGPAWTDLHTSNVKKLNIGTATAVAFFSELIGALGIAKPNYSDGRAFWAMNRKTHIYIMAKALEFNASAALVAGVNNQMPVIGGDIVEIEKIPDNEIIGGFGSVYLLAEREGSVLKSSEHARFAQNQTGFKGYARYDGKPVFGEAFVVVSFDNTDATTSSTFPTDYANTELGVLGVTAAASSSAVGKTVLTVTGTENSGTSLKYKIGDFTVRYGQTVTGYTALTSGTTEIEAAAGKLITVVELNADGRVIKAGKVASVPKTA